MKKLNQRILHTCLGILCMGNFLPTVSGAVENSECMECHSDETLTMESTHNIIRMPITESLYVDEERFDLSVHGDAGISCIDCHSDVEELNWDEDVPHAIPLQAVCCADCHEETANEFKDSVHMDIRKKGITMTCYACHDYHYVQPMEHASVDERTNAFCLKCHNPTIKHDWLPAGDTHFSSVECTVCHAPDAPRHIHLKFFDPMTGRLYACEEFLGKIGINPRDFLNAFDKNNNRILEANELDNLMFLLKRKNTRAVLRAELVADVDKRAHQIHAHSAQNECVECHSADSPYFQEVCIIMTYGDGSVEEFSADRKVLESYHLSHFYLLGGTRVSLLDKLGILIFAGGVLGAFSHLFIRVVTLPKRKNGDDHA